MTKLLKHCVAQSIESIIPNFSCRFLNSNFQFWIIHYNCSNESDQRNLQDHVKKVFCFKNCFYIWINCLGDLDLQPRIQKSFSRSLEQFFLPAGQNHFGNKICFLKLGLILSTHTIKRLFDPHIFFSKNLYVFCWL